MMETFTHSMYTIVMRVTAWQIKSISKMSESHQLGQIYLGVGIEKTLLTFPLSTTIWKHCNYSFHIPKIREGGRGLPQYFCPAPSKSLGQVVKDPFLARPCPQELDCGQNSPENKGCQFALPKIILAPQSQNPICLPA